jgi:flagellar biosynthesis/type III secretory pathway chaperone
MNLTEAQINETRAEQTLINLTQAVLLSKDLQWISAQKVPLMHALIELHYARTQYQLELEKLEKKVTP